jgi:DNA-binding MarR family transcriptional regulator
VLIELTPSGREVATTIRAAMAVVEERALAQIPEGQLAGFRRVLEALANGDD